MRKEYLETMADDGTSRVLDDVDGRGYKAGGLFNYVRNTRPGKYVTGGVAGLALFSMVSAGGCAIGTVNGVPVNRSQGAEVSSEEKESGFSKWVREHPYLTIGGTILIGGAILYGVTQSNGGSDSPSAPAASTSTTSAPATSEPAPAPAPVGPGGDF